ncbi:MAG TPA: hypothetical protein VK203_22785 [Nostocaceae cyanobacterium]|nr:hypothetical protein [Nostocaceae cyanobacterium]
MMQPNCMMQGLQRNNPLHGFTVAVEEPDTRMCYAACNQQGRVL